MSRPSQALQICTTEFFCDSHSHLADQRWGQLGSESDLSKVVKRASDQGVLFFLQAGVDPADWQRQLNLASRYRGILPAFGLHPYSIADRSEEDCEQALDLLAKCLPKAFALGETGLDFRPAIVKESRLRQFAMMEAQLELAHVAQLPVILHVVQAFSEAIQMIDLYLPKESRRGLVHGFNGTRAQAEAWLERGFMISIGGSICRPDNQRLQQALQIIPWSQLLIESDSPDQPPVGWPRPWNEPSSILTVASTIARLRNASLQHVRAGTSENFMRLLNVELQYS